MHQTDDDTSFKPWSGAGKPVAEKGEEHERSSSPGPAELRVQSGLEHTGVRSQERAGGCGLQLFWKTTHGGLDTVL